MLKTRSTWPPGGWMYLEAATGWRLPQGLTFTQSVNAIVQHRKQNKQHNLSTKETEVEATLDTYTCARLKNDPAWCISAADSSFSQPPLGPRHAPAEGKGSAAGAKFLSNVGAGIKTWLEWFGNGKPVDQKTAEERAVVCVNCVKNVKGGIKERFTAIAAKEIFAVFQSLNDLDLHTKLDSELNACSACDCPVKAKVWVPLPHIKKHMASETFKILPENCWIKTE